MAEYREWFERHIQEFSTRKNDLGGGLCPIHGDKNPSLSLNLRTGWVRCFACAWEGPAKKFAEEAGLPTHDLPQRPESAPRAAGGGRDRDMTFGHNRPADAEWTYTDASGNSLYKVLRWNADTPEGKKDFRQLRYGGNGRFYPGMKDRRTNKSVKPVLYRLHVLAAADPAVPVWLVEGEKAADAGAQRQDLLTTTSSGGAGHFNEMDTSCLVHLKGRTVYILPDNDEPGEKHALQASGTLRRAGANVKIVRLPNLPPKGDLVDWLDAGGTLDQLLQLAAGTSAPEQEGPEEEAFDLEPAQDVYGYDYRQTDLGNAEFFAALYGEHLRYSHPLNSWFVWDGRRWAVDRRNRAAHLVNLSARKRLEQSKDAGDADAVKREWSWAIKSESAKHRRACMDQAITIQELVVLPEALDANPWLLNVQNGTLNLSTGKLHPARREDLLTKVCPVTYDPAATCPLWEVFLERILDGNEALIRYVQRAVGYALTGAIRDHAFFICYGRGANGKSTMLETLAALLGPDFTYRLPVEVLLESKRPGGAGPTPELVDLKGRRLAFTSEADQNRSLAEGLVKQLTGGDTITARGLYQGTITYRPSHKLWLTTNHRPEVRGTDDGIWRRIHLIPFTVQIPESERDATLGEKLTAELSGILNWALQGCLAWQKQGLNPPPEVRAATQSYRADSDTLAEFFSERCILAPLAQIKASALFTAYSCWCEARRERPMSLKKFGLSVEERGFQKKRNNGAWYVGIRLADASDEPYFGDDPGVFEDFPEQPVRPVRDTPLKMEEFLI